MTFRLEKYGKWIAIAILLIVAAYSGLYPGIAWRIFWTVVNAESQIAFWTKTMHVPIGEAIAVAIAVGTAETFIWFFLFGWTKRFYERHAKPLYDDIARRIDLKGINGRADWVRVCYRWVNSRVYRHLVPPPRCSGCGKDSAAIGYMKHCAILCLCGFTPTLIWTGVGYAVVLASRTPREIRLRDAKIAVMSGNAAKMVVCGYFSMKIPLWSVFPLVFAGPIVVAYVVGKVKKSKRSGSGAPLSDERMI